MYLIERNWKTFLIFLNFLWKFFFWRAALIIAHIQPLLFHKNYYDDDDYLHTKSNNYRRIAIFMIFFFLLLIFPTNILFVFEKLRVKSMWVDNKKLLILTYIMGFFVYNSDVRNVKSIGYSIFADLQTFVELSGCKESNLSEW